MSVARKPKGIDIVPDPQNVLILETEVFPDYHRVHIEDFDTSDGAESGESACTHTDHSVLVKTITSDEAIDSDTDIRVRIYKGTSEHSLGEPIYSGELTLDSGYLAVGNSEDTIAKCPFELGETIHLQIFADRPSAAREVNVLIDPK
ncbi:hypothetical protein P3H80_12390 [Mycolicibacterium septicum]|uniref:hypothetical protein n=1 Tax=Mycolicibacterium septicum TaxID=98668 RepID=UPI0023E224B5|nr:hypothetical protein [Mycolicibacterium septicum]MDF3338226.1 hypothetical protein [Mycolicibacterium septicum]